MGGLSLKQQMESDLMANGGRLHPCLKEINDKIKSITSELRHRIIRMRSENQPVEVIAYALNVDSSLVKAIINTFEG